MIKSVLAVIVCSIFMQSQAYAEDVQMIIDRVPSADEMAEILFPDSVDQSQVTSKPGVKKRSVSFKKTSSDSMLEDSANASQTLGLPIKFSFNSAEIETDSKPLLNEIGKMMTMDTLVNEKLLIEGHTDATGTEDYNYQLSKRRANAVKNYLVINFQIKPDRLLIKGMGENSPLKGRNAYDPSNRRVQFRRAVQ